jgi:hypothetical protein
MKQRSSLWISPLFVVFILMARAAHSQTQDVLLARTAMRSFPTGHYVEAMEIRDRWIAPDAYYFDAGSGRYREVALGGGAQLLRSKHLTITQEAYIDQALGPDAHHAIYLVPWTYIGYTLTPKVRGETVYFPYFPLNHNGHFEQIVERAKLEYYFPRLKIGAGYGGIQVGGRDWKQKPFLTTTIRGGNLGDLEFWLQRIPGNHVQAQIRYRLTVMRGKKQ